MLFDTHAHLDYPEFQADFDGLLERAKAAGVTKIISIGTDLDSSARAVALAEKHPEIYAVAGWHPGTATEAPDDIRTQLREFAKHPRVVALGETGLDYYRLPGKTGSPAEDGPIKEKQEALFRQHLEVAAETGLNCVIHQRESMADTVAIMEQFAGKVRGQFHCFVDASPLQQKVQALGCLVSFTGIITFKNGEVIRSTAANTPLGQFMVETDCPYLAPVPFRGKRCEPSYVRYVAETIAQVKGITLAEVAEATSQTALKFFPKLAG